MGHPFSVTLINLRVSGDTISRARDQAGVAIALSMRVERAVLDWSPDNSRLCVIRSDSSVRANNILDCIDFRSNVPPD